MASETDFLAPLLGATRDLVAWWKAEQVEGLIIGGLAAALLGRPRVTRDVDGLVWLEDSRWESFLAASARFGFQPRVTVAHRPRDLSDLEALIDAHPKLDRRRVRKHVREFASLLETPELIDDMERLFGRRRKRKR
jgi:hypothetical protein